MARVKKCSLALQAQFRSVQASRWRKGGSRTDENSPNTLHIESHSKNSPISHTVTTRSQHCDVDLLRVALKEVQNELHSSRVILAERTEQVALRESELVRQTTALRQTHNDLKCTQDKLQTTHAKLDQTCDQLMAVSAASQHWYAQLRLECHKAMRWQGKSQGISKRVKELENVLIPSLQEVSVAKLRDLQHRLDDLEKDSFADVDVITGLQEKLQACRRQTKKHQMKALRASHWQNGAYANQFHAIARSLVLAGCAWDSVGSVLKAMGTAFGVEGWKEKVQTLTSLYNESPFSQRNAMELLPLDVTDKLKGVSGDHSSDQLKSFRGLSDWKMENIYTRLGSPKLHHAPPNPVIDKSIPQSPSPAQPPADSDAIIQSYGKQAFDVLPNAEQRALNLIIWAGCCMHKELNAVKGGAAEMAACWEKNANKDNAATLKETAPGDGNSETLMAAELRAVEVSGRGGVKAASIAGAIFNHKDDKKGVHDTHRQYFELYCTTAEELLTYLNDYIKLLIQIRYKKEKRNFSHMEQNLFNALHDSPTLTELAVLIWYSAAVGHPYMYYVQGEGTEEMSVLDLGPLHDQVKLHVQKIIDHPDLLLAEDAYAGTGTLDSLREMGNYPTYTLHSLPFSRAL
ncbi:hypothetical protein PAXINDRAFT_157563 [Paxillus involutus ATCC 200175]|uniref:Unplaced genomic scaffold PAXINscaffold_78, whole genome shotgun sequence n=1 Tax=Paxillus involutus ATCC 200175 TaxID=664439 RepID=A0A0C9T4R7_PAXIN|nr:hypothetical protein PAXINDRAFT_157563 [Paxillus involutus ATCC 200175]